ncbi:MULTISPECIES: porin [Herbaspirillum]|jgi:predicted porin|uniref:Porin n=5 Tax=Pseudomonadota TaxID=1224 RepID=A0AAJ2HJ17_9BURK|nr:MULTISPECIES: porin [Herbaspirillum]MAF05953.1 porin [Herbaspirillum sp.]MBN9359405.1 porin [Herbaspirillum huttiense]MBO15143.1 porin [Herbaspirillum sp.]MBP1314554.1 putative porin [Herbaspirillum sp. 1130]MCO4858517.1 porin [Herbaspirillum sp. WGmk3]|tara:strand:- start:10 stop:1194 length:1185 start_codon:yes stop_codon:yes gene_type:complete
MKKSLLALAVLGAFAGAANAQSSVTIYGIVDTGVVYQSKVATASGGTGTKFGLNSGIIQGSRIGFKGVEDLGGGLSAVFQLETGFSNDTGGLQGSDATTGSNLFRRKSVVGLTGNFGSVLVGRQTDFADTISAYTAVQDFGGWVNNSGSGLDRLQGTRTNNSISYTTNSLNGFTGNLMYGFGETAGQTSAGQSFGIGGKYDNGPLGLGINYYQSKAGSTPSDVSLIPSSSTTTNVNTLTANSGSTAQKVLNVAASYQFGPARVYGNWSRVKQDLNTQANLTSVGVGSLTSLTNRTLARSNKADIYEIGTAYSLSPSLKLLAAVDHTRANFDGVSNKTKLTQVSLGTDYWLSKRTDLYAFLAYTKASDMVNPGVSDSTGTDGNQGAVAVGIRHKF